MQPAKRARASNDEGDFAERKSSSNEAELFLASNLLRLQSEALLAEVSLISSSQLIEKYFESIKNLVCDESFVGDEISSNWMKRQCYSGLSLEEYAKEVAITFIKPSHIQKIGSYSLLTSTKPYIELDILVCLPNECFEERDILNHVYYDKRKLYLGVIAKKILSDSSVCSTPSNLWFEHFKGDIRKPIILFRPKSNSKFLVRIMLSAPEVLNVSKLKVENNSIRPLEWLKSSGTNAGVIPASLKPTPSYNQAILEDFRFIPEHDLIRTALAACPIMRNTIILFKVIMFFKCYYDLIKM